MSPPATAPVTGSSHTPSKATVTLPSASGLVSATPGICPNTTGSPEDGLAGSVGVTRRLSCQKWTLFLAISRPPVRGDLGGLRGHAEPAEALGELLDVVGLAQRLGRRRLAQAAHPARARRLPDRRALGLPVVG